MGEPLGRVLISSHRETDICRIHRGKTRLQIWFWFKRPCLLLMISCLWYLALNCLVSELRWSTEDSFSGMLPLETIPLISLESLAFQIVFQHRSPWGCLESYWGPLNRKACQEDIFSHHFQSSPGCTDAEDIGWVLKHILSKNVHMVQIELEKIYKGIWRPIQLFRAESDFLIWFGSCLSINPPPSSLTKYILCDFAFDINGP